MPQTSSTPIHEQFNHYYNTYVILRVFFPYYDPKVHGIDNTSFTAYFNHSSSFFAAYAQCIFWMLYMASYLYSGTRKIIGRHKNLFSLQMLQTCVIDILTALLYCIGIYVVLSCAIALVDLSPVLVLYDETGLLAFLRLFIGAWVAITHPHLFIIEISMHYSYAFFFISTYPVLCFSIFSIACLVFLFDIRIQKIGSFLNGVLLFMWSIVQEIYDSILSSIFSFFLAHNIHKVFIKYLTWLRFSYYHEDMPDDRTRRHDEIFDPYYQSDQSLFFSLLYHNAYDPSSIYYTLESFMQPEAKSVQPSKSRLRPRVYNECILVLKLIQKYGIDLDTSLLDTLHTYYSLSGFREDKHSSLLHTMLHLAQCEKLTATNIPPLLRALTPHHYKQYQNIRYLLTNISEEHISEELIALIENITHSNRNHVASKLFQVFLTSTSCTYTRSSQNPLSEQELSDFIDVYHMLHSYDTYLQRCFRAPFIQKTSNGRMYDTIENLQHAPTSTKNILHILQRHEILFYNPLFDDYLLTPKNVNNILKKQKDTTPIEHEELSYTLELLGRSDLLNTQTLHDVLEHDIFIPHRNDVRNVLPRYIWNEVWNNIKNAAIDATQRGLTLQAKKDHIAQAILRMFVQPLHAHGRNGGGINYGAQSTHQVKIHDSASAGAILLKERYSSCNVEATIKEILSYINTTIRNNSLKKSDRLIYETAQRSIHYTKNYTVPDPKSQVTAREFLALGWVGLCDDNPSYHPESYSKDDAIYSFLKVLRDIMRCYNYNDEFIDQGGRDIPSCPGGAFNKIHEALSCHIIGIRQTLGTMADLTSAFQHTVQKLWAECPALEERETLTSDDYATHLQKDVHKKLTEDFASFSDKGRNLITCLSKLEESIEDMEPPALVSRSAIAL